MLEAHTLLNQYNVSIWIELEEKFTGIHICTHTHVCTSMNTQIRHQGRKSNLAFLTITPKSAPSFVLLILVKCAYIHLGSNYKPKTHH